MKKSTVTKFIGHLEACINMRISKRKYQDTFKLCNNYFCTKLAQAQQDYEEGNLEEEDWNRIKDLYNQTKAHLDPIETDDAAEVSYDRNEEGNIISYSYCIFKRNKPSLVGKLTREEMNSVYRLYSYYGAALTQRVVSRHFPDLSLVDFKRILRAFNITKASAPFAPHMVEEKSIDELREIQLREKENDFLRKAEEDRVKNNETLLRKYAQENIELKERLQGIKNIDFESIINNVDTPYYVKQLPESGKSLILHLSDVHIGAKVESNSLYDNEWNGVECKRRLQKILEAIPTFGHLDTLIINLMGDMIDGMDGQTARRDHIMPQNMDNMEQIKTYINLMMWFVKSIYESGVCNNLKIYSVKDGNHDGISGYLSTSLLLSQINLMYPNVYTKIFEDFFGYYEFGGHTWVISHGKDDKHMKRGLPVNLDDKNKAKLYEWLQYKGLLNSKKVHIVKGDLHTENFNSCNLLDYRNVLSLFGASDYSNYNFGRNQYGISYEYFIGDNLMRGTLENM